MRETLAEDVKIGDPCPVCNLSIRYLDDEELVACPISSHPGRAVRAGDLDEEESQELDELIAELRSGGVELAL